MKTDRRSINAAWRLARDAWLDDQALIVVHVNPRSVTRISLLSSSINWQLGQCHHPRKL